MSDGDLAHGRARHRAHRPRRAKLNLDVELREVVQAKLELEWSSEQNAAHLREAIPDRPQWHICHETIYRALYLVGQGGLNRAADPATAPRAATAQTPPAPG